MLLDEHLRQAPLMRSIGARLLTRSLAPRAGATPTAIAQELQIPAGTLMMMVARAGGASIAALRREMVLVRLAAMFEDRALPWRVVLEILGMQDIDPLMRIIRRETELSPGVWRRGTAFDRQFERFRTFIAANAAPWAQLPRPHRICPHCHAILPDRAA